MTELVTSVADKIDRAVQKVTPFAYRMQRKGRRWMRRALRKPRSVSEGPNLLPLLIQVLASFSKADGVLLEEEIDSSLGFLALRLSGNGLFGTPPAFPPGPLRAAGSLGHGPKAQLAVERRPQNHARGPALRPHFPGGIEAGAGRRLLLVHVAARDGGPGNRHRLSIERLGGFRSFHLPAGSVTSGIGFFRFQRQRRCHLEEPGRQRSAAGVSLS